MRELFEEDGKGSPGPRDKKRRRPCRSVLAFGTLVAYLLSFSSQALPTCLVTTIFNPQVADNSRAQPEMYPCGLTSLDDSFISHPDTIQQLIRLIRRTPGRKSSRETHTSCRIP